MSSAWITPTIEALLGLLTQPEEAAARTRHLAPGQADPAPRILADVTALVRGYVATSGIALGPVGTVPPELHHAVLVLARQRLLSRLPVAAGLLNNDTRRQEHDDAMGLLRDVSKGLVAVTPGEDGARVAAPQIATPRITPRTGTGDRTAL